MEKKNLDIESFLGRAMDDADHQLLRRASALDAKKDEVWKNVRRTVVAEKSSMRRALRYAVRIAAVIVPVVAMAAGVIWGVPVIRHSMSDEGSLEQTTYESVDLSGVVIDTLVLRNADLRTVVNELMARYDGIKGVKGNIDGDSVLVTTSFEKQSLNDIIEELNFHFNQKISLDSNGYLTISD